MMRVAIVGCGQLARMMALAGLPMGISFSFLAQPGESAVAVAGLGAVCEWEPGMSGDELFQGLGRPDVISLEKEQIDVAMLKALEAYCPVYPNSNALYQCQNRLRQKTLLTALKLPCTPYRAIESSNDLMKAMVDFGLPVVIKHTEHGYDGKSQWLLASLQEAQQWLANHFDENEPSGSWLVEAFMPFEREVSFLAVRGQDGEIRHYPATQNQHRQSVLISSLAPAPDVPEPLLMAGQLHLASLLTELDYVGVMAMECFVVRDQLWVNELAPRVHNSGHWTLQAPVTSQFENHLRAIAGWPLGETELRGAAGMLNLLGVSLDQATLLQDGAGLNWYNKEVRPGRKVGHITIRDTSSQAAGLRLARLQESIYGRV